MATGIPLPAGPSTAELIAVVGTCRVWTPERSATTSTRSGLLLVTGDAPKRALDTSAVIDLAT